MKHRESTNTNVTKKSPKCGHECTDTCAAAKAAKQGAAGNEACQQVAPTTVSGRGDIPAFGRMYNAEQVQEIAS